MLNKIKKKELFIIVVLLVIVVIIVTVFTHPSGTRRNWSDYMTMPTEEQLSRPGTYRSPYIGFFPELDGGLTSIAMDFRIDHDPVGTYICPISWNINVDGMNEKFARLWTDYGDGAGGYFGFQVLNDGTKAVIMTLWDVLWEDEDGNVGMIKPKVISPQNARVTEYGADENDEGSFVQCIYPFEWETGKDYRYILEQTTGESGTDLYTLWLMDPKGTDRKELFCFDSGLTDTWIQYPCGFVENFMTETAAYPRTLEFWNVRAKMKDSGEWKNAENVSFSVNGSYGDLEYEGSWNLGQDENSCWIITSGVTGLCTPPENLGPYLIPSTESGAPDGA